MVAYSHFPLYQDWLAAAALGQAPGIPILLHGEASVNQNPTWLHSMSLESYSLVANPVRLSSTSAADSLTQAGARRVLLRGVDASFALQEEVLPLNGLSPVTSSLSYLHLYEAMIVQAGASLTNQGTLYIGFGSVLSTGVNTQPTLIIPVRRGKAPHLSFCVPARHRALLLWLLVSGANSSVTVQYFLQLRSPHHNTLLTLAAGQVRGYAHPLPLYHVVPSHYLIGMYAQNITNTTSVPLSAHCAMLLLPEAT